MPQHTAGQQHCHHPADDLRQNTTHVAMEELKTASLAGGAQQEPVQFGAFGG
jgi:hypothetical protein